MNEKTQLFALTSDLKGKIDAESKQLGVSQGALCRMAISQYIEGITVKRAAQNGNATQ